MTKESIWNKNLKITEEEKKAIDKHIKEKIGTTENLEDFDSAEATVKKAIPITSINKEKFEIEIDKLEDEICSLIEEVERFQKGMFNSNTNSEYEEKLKEVQKRLDMLEKHENKIAENKEKIKTFKKDLQKIGQMISGIKEGKENLN